MSDKFQDIRNKIVDCDKCQIVRVYQSETQIVVKIGSKEPMLFSKNSLNFEVGSNGEILIKNGCCQIIATACDASYIRKENGDTYSENYDELLVLLSAFLGVENTSGLQQEILERLIADTWTTIPGNSVALTYYAAGDPDNPGTSVNNVATATYSNAAGVVFTQTFTYDSNSNILTIIVS